MPLKITTTATFTCSRCKTTLCVDIPPPPPQKHNPELAAALETLEDDETDFDVHCREVSYLRSHEVGWSSISLQQKSFIAKYHLCPECSSDAQQFMTDIESFERTEDSKCPIFDRYCSEHEFHHGAEATELREGIEKILKRSHTKDLTSIDFDVMLTRLLENVDARDSLAYAEYLEQERKHGQETTPEN